MGPDSELAADGRSRVLDGKVVHGRTSQRPHLSGPMRRRRPRRFSLASGELLLTLVAQRLVVLPVCYEVVQPGTRLVDVAIVQGGQNALQRLFDCGRHLVADCISSASGGGPGGLPLAIQAATSPGMLIPSCW